MTLTNKQGGGWRVPRQGAEGVPGLGGGGGGLLPVIYGRGDVELSAFGSRLLTVSSPDCYAREGCKGKNHHSCVVAVT